MDGPFSSPVTGHAQTSSDTSDVDFISIDEAIDLIDWGPFQLHLLCLIGLCTACDSMEVGLIAFIQECVKEEWGLSNNEEALLASSILIGQILGMLSASIADYFGRRPITIGGLWAVIIFGFASTFSPDYVTLLALRGLVGFGIGLSQTVSYDLCCELLPRKYRNYIMICDILGVVAQVYLIICLFFLLSPFGWRSVLFACAVPVLVVGVGSIWIFVESPRWLLTQGRVNEAKETLAYIANYNGSVRSDGTLYNIEHFSLNFVKPRYGEEIDGGYTVLFSERYIVSTIHLWIIWFCAYFTFFSVLFSLVALQENKGKETCSYEYTGVVISGSVDVVFLLLCMVVIDWMGRPVTQSCFYGLSSAFALAWAVAAFDDPGDVLVLTTLLILSKSLYVGGMEAMWYVDEIYIYYTIPVYEHIAYS